MHTVIKLGDMTIIMSVEESRTMLTALVRNGFTVDAVYSRAPMRVSPSGAVYIVSVVYLALFVVGAAGNLTILGRVVATTVRGKAASVPTLAYIGLFCINDLAYLATVPLMIHRQVVSDWWFGNVVCKLYMFVESTAKTMTGFTLMLIAYERFVGVRHPLRHRHPRRFVTAVVAVGALVIAALFNLPIAYQTSAERMPPFEAQFTELTDSPNNSLGGKLRYIYRESCAMPLTTDVVGIATLALLAGGGFLTPFVVTAALYSRIYRQLVRRCPDTSKIPTRKIGVRSLVVSLFYLCCYGPYWTVIVVTMAFSESAWLIDVSQLPMYTYVMWAVHALPLLNTTANWVFYGIMNSQLSDGGGGGWAGDGATGGADVGGGRGCGGTLVLTSADAQKPSRRATTAGVPHHCRVTTAIIEQQPRLRQQEIESLLGLKYPLVDSTVVVGTEGAR